MREKSLDIKRRTEEDEIILASALLLLGGASVVSIEPAEDLEQSEIAQDS